MANKMVAIQQDTDGWDVDIIPAVTEIIDIFVGPHYPLCIKKKGGNLPAFWTGNLFKFGRDRDRFFFDSKRGVGANENVNNFGHDR